MNTNLSIDLNNSSSSKVVFYKRGREVYDVGSSLSISVEAWKEMGRPLDINIEIEKANG